MISAAAELARRLAHNAEAVCRHYLSKGRRSGRYWIIGDVQNTPGRSLHVRLSGPDYGPGAAGKWTDAASGRAPPAPAASPEAARRLFRAGRPVPGTPVEAYLRARGITAPLDWPSLRYHPSVYYREVENAPLEQWPALLAAVTAHDGTITGILRTWLDRHRPAKASLADPRRAMGHLLGNAVRFGEASAILAAGEGVETMLALKSVLPRLPMAAGLSANHLAALEMPPSLRRLYVARDNDAAGRHAAERLRERAAGIEVRELVPVHADFNLDLCRLGADGMRGCLADQLVASDRTRFLNR